MRKNEAIKTGAISVFRYLILLAVCINAHSLVAQVNLEDGLEIYYDFNGAPEDLTDNTSATNDSQFTLTSDCDGNIDSAIQFNGANNYLKLSNSSGYNPTTDFMISFMFKVPETQEVLTSAVNSLLSKWILESGDHDKAGYPYTLRLFNQSDSRNGKLVFAVSDGLDSSCRNTSTVTTDATYNDNEFHTVAIGREGNMLKLYVDCVLIGEMEDISECSISNEAKIILGARNETVAFNRPNNLNGALDEFRYHSRFLNMEEIESLCKKTVVNEICDNGIDDDNDGFIDCLDPDLANDCCCITPVVLDIGEDVTLCFGDSYTINANEGYATYSWSTQETTENITVTESGSYTVMVSDSCDNILEATINVTFGEEYSNVTTHYFAESESITINGVLYDTEGEYIQNFTSVNGCDSNITLQIYESKSLVHYDLDDCYSYVNNGANIYDEFDPNYTGNAPCTSIAASILYRNNSSQNLHSCTPGVNGNKAMCISSQVDCDYESGSDKSLIFDMSLLSNASESMTITQLSFYHKAPENFDWIDGPSGPNNYPSLFGIRVLSNGVEVFKQIDIATGNEWDLATFELPITQFEISELTDLTIEILPYCTTENNSTVTAWDIDELTVSGFCKSGLDQNRLIAGTVTNTDGAILQGFDVIRTSASNEATVQTDSNGQYAFPESITDISYTIEAHSDQEPLKGVSTLDLLMIQKHILGFAPFENSLQLIAADINNSKSISALDLIELRKLILGVNTNFDNNHSTLGVFTNTDELSNQYFTDELIIESNTLNSSKIDITAVKIGDVNHASYDNINSVSIENRNDVMILDSKLNKSDHNTTVDFYLDDIERLLGLQVSLYVDQCNCTIISNQLNIDPSHYNTDQDGNLNLSWYTTSHVLVDTEQALFSIVCTDINCNAITSDMKLNTLFENEIYTEGDDENSTNLSKLKINQFDKNLDITTNTGSVSPNPFTNKVEIKSDLLLQGDVMIKVYDLSGRLVKSHTTKSLNQSTMDLDLTSLSFGVYNLRINTPDSSKIFKIIKIQ